MFRMNEYKPNDYARYLQPRCMYDQAIISDEGPRCVYDEDIVHSILTEDYILTLNTAREYAYSSPKFKELLSRDRALSFMRWLQLGCHLHDGPLIIRKALHQKTKCVTSDSSPLKT
jgi:hypothetical protein